MESRYIFKFFLEVLVVGKFEGRRQMRLQSVRRPDATDCRWTHRHGCRHRGAAPMGSFLGFGVECFLDDCRAEFTRNRSNASRAGFIFDDPGHAELSITLTPTPRLASVLPELQGDILVLQTSGGKQNDLRRVDEPLGIASAGVGGPPKPLALFIGQMNLGCSTHNP